MAFISSSFLINHNPLKADYDYFGIDASDGNGYDIYTINSSTGEETLLSSDRCKMYNIYDGCEEFITKIPLLTIIVD